MPEDQQLEEQTSEWASPGTPLEDAPADLPASLPQPEKPRGIAPIWHTLILIAAILGYSIWGAIGAHHGTANPAAPPSGASHAASSGADHTRLIRYGLTGALEVAIVLWVAFGLRLRKIAFRSLFGAWPSGLNGVTKEILIASAFWIGSMIILGVCAFWWLFAQNLIYRQQIAKQATSSSASGSNNAKPKSPEQQQAELIRQLTELAPANGIEIAAWGLLCLVVGFSEELIFRGYLQSQGMALLRNAPIAIIATAAIFGAAHGYQGVRGIVLISVFGSLFGILTRLRRNLLPGMVAHAWHDFCMGMLLALVRATPELLKHSASLPK